MNLLASLDVLWDHQLFTLCCWDKLRHVWWCFYSWGAFYWEYLLVYSSVSFSFAFPTHNSAFLLFLLWWRWALIKQGSIQNSLTITLCTSAWGKFVFWFSISCCSSNWEHSLQSWSWRISHNIEFCKWQKCWGIWGLSVSHVEICTFVGTKGFMWMQLFFSRT